MSSDPKIAIVTGAGSGIGRAVALALLARDYKVVLVGRRMEKLEETAALAKGETLAIAADVSVPADVARLYHETLQAWGRVDLLFNNAGLPAPKAAFEDIAFEDWQKVVAVNLTGMFLMAQGAFRAMKSQTPQGGRIINNGSISAHTPRPNSAPYTATKHAVTGLTKSLSLDGRPYGIACGQIDIGNASTDMTSAMSAGVPQPNGTMMAEPTMPVAQVADAVCHMAELPLGTNVQFMTIMATAMPFVGRG